MHSGGAPRDGVSGREFTPPETAWSSILMCNKWMSVANTWSGQAS